MSFELKERRRLDCTDGHWHSDDQQMSCAKRCATAPRSCMSETTFRDFLFGLILDERNRDERSETVGMSKA